MRSTRDFSEATVRTRDFYAVVGICVAIAAAGLVAAQYMASAGHHVTGMSDRVVWGLPHVLALLLILAGAGAMSVASLAVAWQRRIYARLARLSCVVAMALLAGGLAILLLDLGRPDNLVRGLGSLNTSSIFSLNLFVYTGFFVIGIALLWTLLEYRMNRYARLVGALACFWQILLASDIGSVFAVLSARPAYDSAILAPLAVAMSLALGLGVFVLVMLAAMVLAKRPCGTVLAARLGRLLALCLLAALYLTALQHIVQSYGRFESVALAGYGTLFWLGQVLLGGLLPLALLYHPALAGRLGAIAAAAALAVLGGFCWLYVTVIGGQAYPLPLFPGMTVGGADGEMASYAARWPELLLGAGGVALALLLVAVAVKVLAVLPTSLADAEVPHHRPAAS